MLEDDIIQETKDYYFASCQLAISQMFSGYLGVDWQMPTLYSILHHEEKDLRSPEEIKQHVLSRLKGG